MDALEIGVSGLAHAVPPTPAPGLRTARLPQASAVGFGGGELGLELVAQRHQFVHPGDDAALFVEGWERERESKQAPLPVKCFITELQ